MQEVVIIGGKGTAINIAEQIEDARTRFAYPMKVVGFAIDDPLLGADIAGFPVVSGVKEAWAKYKDTGIQFVFALYRPDVMRERLALLRALPIPADRFANFVHPLAYVSRSVERGHGNVVMSHAVLQHAVSLGNFNVINSQVVVEHESRLGDGVFLAAGACIGARVTIGDGVFVGLNSTVREDVSIDDFAFVGMSSGVLRHVARETAVHGLPARPRA